jgi:hypothetical protein
MFDTGPTRAPRTRRIKEDPYVFHLIPAATSVSVDTATGRPREIRTNGQRLAVTALESVRDETSAYSLRTGPRTVFVVHAAGRRFRLVHQLRDRRWSIEDLGTHPQLASVA